MAAALGAPDGLVAWNAANADGNCNGKKPPLPAVPGPTVSLSGIITHNTHSL